MSGVVGLLCPSCPQRGLACGCCLLWRADGFAASLKYEPGESTLAIYGGNSNWRGPVWFPVNFLMIESLQMFDRFFGDDFKVDFPTGSGVQMTLWQVAEQLSVRVGRCVSRGGGRHAVRVSFTAQWRCPPPPPRVLTRQVRLTNTFRKGPDGTRPVHGSVRYFSEDPRWSEYIPFFEYFVRTSLLFLGAVTGRYHVVSTDCRLSWWCASWFVSARRLWRWPGCVPSDGLDGVGGQADSTVWCSHLADNSGFCRYLFRRP